MIKPMIPALALMLMAPVALIGCGDSGKNNGSPDGGLVHDGAALDGSHTDVLQAMDAASKADVAMTLDTNAPDGGGTVDVHVQLDAAAVDAHPPLDAGALDVHGLDGLRPVDGGTLPSQGLDAAAGDGGAAGLRGSTVTGTLYNPNLQTILGGPATAVVGASTPTFPNGTIVGNTAFEINVTTNQITYKPLANVGYGGGAFNGFVFVFTNAPTILGVTLDPASNFKPTSISFTGNSVSLNLSGNTVATDSVAILDVQLAP